MAKIYEARIDQDALEYIDVAPPTRKRGWVWALVFVVLLASGAALGLSVATGSFSNAVEVARNGIAGGGDIASN